MTAAVAPKAGRREWFGLAALALPTFLVAIDIFVLVLALPALTADLGADSNQQLWITDIYGFVLAGFTVTMGTVGDRIGRRKLLLIGAAAFTAVSVVAAWSTSAEMLIVTRALLGIAGATLMPSTLALITNLFQDEKQRAAAFGVWGGTFTLGMVVGPLIGGALLENFWWGSVFLISVPVMATLLVVGPKLLPEYKNGQPGRVDPLSIVLSLATMLPVIYGIKALARDGWDALPVVAIVVGVVAGYLFGRRQNRLADPLLDLSIFKNRSVSVTIASQLSYSTVGGGLMLFMMLYFQIVKGLSTVQTSLAMTPGLLAATAGFATLPKLASKFRPAYVIAGGMFGVAAALVICSFIGASTPTAALILAFVLMSYSGAALVALGMNLVFASAPPEKAGSAGSIAQMSNEFGGTLGAAVFGTIGFAVYRSEIADSIPAGVPGGAADAAQDSLAGAAAVATSLPGSLADGLLRPAYAAFADGLNTVAIIGAVLIAAAGVLMGALLKHVPPIGAAPAAAETPAEEEAETAPV